MKKEIIIKMISNNMITIIKDRIMNNMNNEVIIIKEILKEINIKIEDIMIMKIIRDK